MTVLKYVIRRRAKWMLTILLSAFGFAGLSQQTDTLRLKGVEIFATGPQRDMVGADVQVFSPSQSPKAATRDVGQFVKYHTDLDLRGYGPGSSTGLSVRGSSTSQTQVSINGIPFEVPSLALTDLSVLPVAAFDRVAIYRGSAAAYLGNAAVGGAVMLDTRSGKANPGFAQTFTAGSFGALGSTTRLVVGDENFSAGSTVYFRYADNDFLRPDAHRPDQLIRQKNAAIHSRGWVQNFDLRTGNTRYNVLLWANQTDREIPPTRSQAEASGTQADRNIRAQITTLTQWMSLRFESALAYDRGALNYADPSTRIDDHSDFGSVHARAKAILAIGEAEVYAMLNFRSDRAETATYDKSHRRDRPSATVGGRSEVFGPNTRASAVLRFAWLNGGLLPILPVIGLEHDLGDQLVLSATAGRTYRLPGMNDLYWNPGGNPELKPESGWFQEGAVRWNRSEKRLNLRAVFSVFHRLVDNWILWRPGPGYWSPANLRSVETSGMEIRFEAVQDLDGPLLNHCLSATAVRSQSTEPAFEGDRSTGLQLVYVPAVTALWRSEAELVDGRLIPGVVGRFVGRRFVTADHGRSLEPYVLFDIEIAYRSRVIGNSGRWTAFAAVRNVFDKSYQMQPTHYMPGRFFETGLRMNLSFDHQSIM